MNVCIHQFLIFSVFFVSNAVKAEFAKYECEWFKKHKKYNIALILVLK
jgi:hypothetical protein